MRARKFLLIAVVVVVALIAARVLAVWVGGMIGGSPTTQPTVGAQLLTFADEDLRFGPIPDSEQIERDLRLTNPTGEAVAVERFETSCSCLGVEPNGQFTLQPGETKALRLKLKGSIPLNQQPDADGYFAETVDVTAVSPTEGGKPKRANATLRYTMRATVRFDPAEVRVGVVSHRDPLTVKATLTLYPPIEAVRVGPNPAWTVSVTGEGSKRELVAVPTKPGVPRVLDETIHLTPVDAKGAEKPVRTLRIFGEVKPDVIGSPADIPLGRVAMGKTVEESFRLVSLTKRKFEVVKAESESPDVTVTTDPTDPKLFIVRVTIKERGEQEWKVTVKVKQDDGSELTATIPVRYHDE